MVLLKSEYLGYSDYEEFFPELDVTVIKSGRIIPYVELGIVDKTPQGVLDAVELLSKNPCVQCVTPNVIGHIASAVYPDDPYYVDLWNMDAIDAPEAWSITTGSSSVKVGVLDTGINPVDDLVDNVNYTAGINYDDRNSLPYDDNGHGTHVAGIIGAVGNNETDVAGVCWNVELIPFKVTDCNGNALYSGVVNAVEDADLMGIPILNLSVDINLPSYTLESIFSYYSGLVVISAGNTASNIDYNITFPAEMPIITDNVIVVGSTEMVNGNEVVSSTSSYGTASVQLFAPGENIYSTYFTGGVIQISGTSMAAPHVAGAAALLLSLHPRYTTEHLMEAILNSTDSLSSLTGYCSTGGRLNVKKALDYTIIGDIDKDGGITNADLIILSRYLVELIDLDDDQLIRADVNEDGNVTNTDAIILSSIILTPSM